MFKISEVFVVLELCAALFTSTWSKVGSEVLSGEALEGVSAAYHGS